MELKKVLENRVKELETYIENSKKLASINLMEGDYYQAQKDLTFLVEKLEAKLEIEHILWLYKENK